MTTIIIGFVLSAFFAVVTTFVVREAAIKLGAVDNPDGVRKVHSKPVATAGGIAVWLATFMPVALLLLSSSWVGIGKVLLASDGFVRVLLGLFVGGTIALGLGLWDDLADLRPRNKFIVQILAGAAAWLIGIRIDTIAIPFFEWDLHMGLASLPLTVFWYVGCMNAINLVDGLDGLAAGLSLLVLLAMTVIGTLFGHPAIAFLAACTAGAILGFLRYNFHPASIFLGDSGSMFLGFAIATLSLSCAIVAKATGVALLVPITALGLPIMDVVLAMIRRWVRKLPFSVSDRDHLHHRLLRMGLGHRQAVLTLWAICLLFSLAALLIAMDQAETALIVLGSMVIASLVFARIFGGVALRHLLWRVKGDLRQRSINNESRMAVNRAVHELEQAHSFDKLWSVLEKVFADLGFDYACMHVCDSRRNHPERRYQWSNGVVAAPDQETLDIWEGRHILNFEGATFGTITMGRHLDERECSQELLTLACNLKCAVAHQVANIVDDSIGRGAAFSTHLLPQPVGANGSSSSSGLFWWNGHRNGKPKQENEKKPNLPPENRDERSFECAG